MSVIHEADDARAACRGEDQGSARQRQRQREGEGERGGRVQLFARGCAALHPTPAYALAINLEQVDGLVVAIGIDLQ